MKQFMLRSLMLLSVLLSSLGISDAWAQLTTLEQGSVYHFTNVGREGQALAATNPTSVAGIATNTSSKAQLWYVEKVNNGYYALRNLGYGTYLQANGQSSHWSLATTTDAENSWIQLSTVGSNNVFKGYTYGDYGFAHIDNSSNIVGWTTGATSTQWTISPIDMSETDIQNALSVFNNVATYQTHLDAIFTDKSCTTLKANYDESDVNALPETLQNMVRKVAGGDEAWTEANKDNTKASWDADYAKKYRVQLYEPYNEPECAASALGLNAHTNLNNPTGIFANNGDVLYVMVEDKIETGSSLYLSYYTGHGKLGGYKNGFELKQGLNVIPVYSNGTNFCINYVVHTFDTSKGKGNKAKARRLSAYKPIKIHIEGGYINGYYNKMGDDLYPADKNANWEYIEARATQTDVTILGKYMTLQFPLLDKDAVDNGGGQNKGLASYFNDLVNVEDCINEWDNVMLWERLLLGVLGESTIKAEAKESPYSVTQTKEVFEYTGGDGEFESDYSDYYNVHGLSFGTDYNYMYGGWDHCGYNFNTMGGVIKDLSTSSGAHWGPAHEIGHQHQGLLNMRGLTEVTNNLFSNVVLWYFGETTSRYNGTEGALSNVLAQFNAEGTDFFSNNIWAQTIMYYKLFLYYHVLGHNPKFYPRLFEMLRQDPMTIEYYQDGSKCLMHFYKKCCEAAGEDLTEFFRAHGFFEVMDNRFVGDYSNAEYTLTQEQIDAAIAEVKAQAEEKGWKENIAVLFINDATGETIKSHKGDNLEKYGETTVCAEMGSYSNFNSEPSNYTYSISGSTVTMEGTGGVGFAILNEKGEIIGFSDKKTFEISAEAAAAIASGKASFVTFNGDNSFVAATNIMDAGDNDTKYELLGNLLDDAKALLDLTDETGTKVGYYRTSALTDLQTAYTTAKGVYDEKTVAAYSSVYDVLFQEYANLINNAYARINITEGYAYRLVNKAYPGRSMAVGANDVMSGLATDENSDAQLWYFEPGTGLNTYYLKNKSTSKYPAGASTGAVLSADRTETTDTDKNDNNNAAPYTLQHLGGGVFALINGPALHCSSSQSYNIVGWGADADASQWTITAVALDEALEARTKLEEVISKTEALVNEMAEVQIKGNALDMSTCNITSNATETGHETKYLIDNNTGTFFHTVWSGTAVQAHHNIVVDLGEENSLEQFVLNYTTSNAANVDAPTAMVVEGSNDGSTYTEIQTLSNLPTTKTAQYTSATLGAKGIPYRYIRLRVTEATGDKLGEYYYFGMAELGLVNMQTVVHSVQPAYSTAEATIIAACDELYNATLTYKNNAATRDELQEATSALSEKYAVLLEAFNAPKNAAFEAKKEELQTLINTTTTLFDECGSVKYTEETTPQLNVTEAPYLLSDNNGASKGSLDKLYDGLQGENNSYTSNWEDRPDEASYLQVDLGLGKEEEKLIFTFTNRNEGNAPTPTEIVVSASADGNQFTTLTTFTSEEANWPPAPNGQNIAATKWTSPAIQASSACRYWRFTVTESQRSTGGETNSNGIYHFGISEFGIVIPAGCNVTVKPGLPEVTPELLLATYDENQEAQSTLTYATTEAQLDKAITQLQAQYNVLLDAKNQQYVQALQEKIKETEELIADCGSVENGEVVEVFERAGDVTKQQLLDAYNQVVAAKSLIARGNASQSEYETATSNLEEKRAALATAKTGTVKSTLRDLTKQISELITRCTTTPGDATETMIQEMIDAYNAAIDLLAKDELVTIEKMYDTWQEQYNTLDAAQQSTAKKELRTEIATLEKLIALCQTIAQENSVTKDVTCSLQTTDSEAEFYLSSNAAANEDDIHNLVDNDMDSYFHSDKDVAGAHYLLVDAGENNKLTKFRFSYQTYNSPFPYTIVVEGSNNKDDFTKLATFTKDNLVNPLPTMDNKRWTSSDITDGNAYRYLRFNITESGITLKIDNEKELDTSNGEQLSNKYQNSLFSATPQSASCFVMSEFKLIERVDEACYPGSVTAELLNEVKEDKEDVEERANNSAVQADLIVMKGDIEGIYNDLYEATSTQVKLTTTDAEKDKLLSNIEYGTTIGTFSAPYATLIPERVTAYYAQQEYNGGTVSLTAIEDATALPANQGVILIGEVGVNSVTFYPATDETPANLSANKFSNSATSSVVMGSNDYILAKGDQGIGFYQAEEGTTLKQGKAFFRILDPSTPFSFVLKFGGNTTDIDAVTTGTPSDHELIYDIYGRRVTEVKKGNIYIKNGKKFFVK